MAGSASPAPPVWERQGLVIPPGLPGPGWSAHCQMPTPYPLGGGRLRMFYTSRDAENRAHVFWADLEEGSDWRIAGVSDGPVLTPGPPGRFDAAGVMPTAAVARDGVLWLYYIGWTVRRDVPYHNAIGIAESRDGGASFERLRPGPVVGTSAQEPYFCGTAEVARHGGRWIMWYMSTTEWREVAGRPEPRYHLKQGYSDDGLHWQHGRDIAVDYLSGDEGGIARATVLRSDGGSRWMWFCHRGLADYRGTGSNAYRLGVAHAPDGLSWRRLPGARVFRDDPAPGAFDAHMQCYPAVHATGAGTWLFYNGSDFGQTGIGVARLRAVDPAA